MAAERADWRSVPCKPAPGTPGTDGYMRIRWNGDLVLAHRYAYEAHYDLIPHGMVVCHHCDNPACWEPLHLFLGTQRDNMRDAKAKGRNVHGDTHGMTKVSEAAWAVLVDKYQAGAGTYALAREYGVTQGAVFLRLQRCGAWRPRGRGFRSDLR